MSKLCICDEENAPDCSVHGHLFRYGQRYTDWVEKHGKTNSPLPRATFGAYEKQVGGTHYKDMKIQPVEFIVANNLNFLAGNIVKYVSRYTVKGGIDDLEKAKHYIEMLIETERD